MTDTSTVIENTQGDIVVVYGNPQSKLADDPLIVGELKNEDGSVPTQSASQDSNHVPHTPRQSSSYTQNGNSSGSNRPGLHNIFPNNYLPNHSDSGPRQDVNTMPGASPTTPKVSNRRSFNAKTTNIDNSGRVTNIYFFKSPPRNRRLPVIKEGDIRDGGRSINTDSEEEYEPSSPSSYYVGVPLLS